MFEDTKVGAQQIKFSGTPFIIVGNQLLDCRHGTNHQKSRKERTQNAKMDAKVCNIMRFVALKDVHTGPFIQASEKSVVFFSEIRTWRTLHDEQVL